MMIKNYDKSIEINNNPNWPYTGSHPYRILIVHDSGLGKTNNVLLKLTSQTICWQKLFVPQVFLGVKVSVVYQQKKNTRD